MTVTIDKFGRIVIPKSIRTLMGIGFKQELQLEMSEEGLLIKPSISEEADLKIVDGLPLIIRPKSAKVDSSQLDNIVKKDREERIDYLIKSIFG